MFCRDGADLQRELTVSRKSERLVNLTIALLHTRRHLTKNEIFSRVAGYEGSPEAMERMFERDKDELRSTGIKIDVTQIDPLFNDETGYRIFPESYALDVSGLDNSELSLLAVAASAFEEQNRDLLIRLRSLAPEASFAISKPALSDSPEQLSTVVDAIENAITITFSYRNQENLGELRSVEPYGLYSRHGFWYLVGRDLDKKEIRTFRFDRIVGEIATLRRPAFHKDPDFVLEKFFQTSPKHVARIRARKGEALDLRSIAMDIEEREDDFDILSIEFIDPAFILERVLWHLDSVVVLEPQELRLAAESALRQVVKLHE